MPMKSTVWKRARIKVAILGCSGILAAGDLGCFSFGANQGLSSIDFCFLLNCNDGAIGGLIDFCSQTNFTSFVGDNTNPNNQNGGLFLSDCPEQQ